MDILGIIGFDWRPIVEILILAVGIFYGFSFVRGTRGASIVTGFLVVMLTLSFVVSLLNLIVLRWLLGSLMAFLVVAVLVIFQPEIRRLLAKVGNLQLFGNAHAQRENIEIIIQTLERLSEVRIGALIAIEQTTPLTDMVESGVTVDCLATPEMLETIFFPNNAIHDGGVIIKGDRIARAACIFPLTRRQDLNKSLGTRHRAAIGLSEEADAVIVVVSEETGSISYAYKGQLTRGVTAENLRAFLSTIFVTQERPRNLVEWLRAWGNSFTRVRASPSNSPPPAVAPAPPVPERATPPKTAPPLFRTGTDY
ncbi:MAG TPA: diadenylate cyclase CdaA [Verrucomicrobiae bacterium]|nr:diadenylate cyclase CdaA [Verrucomicrobiae bacterium]